MNTTFDNNGKALTVTEQGVTMPFDYSFETVNDYVHSVDREFEELQWLCLGMANYIDKLHKKFNIAEVKHD